MSNRENFFTIKYGALGTISIAELRQAILADLASLENDHEFQFTTAPRLVIPVTSEWGDAVPVSKVYERDRSWIDTVYYRPACKDFEL